MYYINDNNYWRDDLDSREVMVSIHCITYNHENYIRDALEGFVKQQTNFRFEAIVHDDCSTDGTAAIIREYAERYPSIIKPIFEEENLYSKKDGSLSRVMNTHIRGKYVAYCEGDDYWTDPRKLQKQVDFLSTHPDYSMCFHNAKIKCPRSTKNDRLFANLEIRDYSGPEIHKNWIVPTASVLIKKEVLANHRLKKAIAAKIFPIGDLLLFLAAADMGKISCIDNRPLCAYRIHGGGVTQTIFRDHYRTLRWVKQIPRFFGPQYRSTTKEIISNECLNMLIDSYRAKKLKDMMYAAVYSLCYAPKQMCGRLINYYHERKHGA